MNNLKTKDFDCLEFKYKTQERIYNEIKNLNPEEEKEYFNRKVKESSFKDFVESLVKSPGQAFKFKELKI